MNIDIHLTDAQIKTFLRKNKTFLIYGLVLLAAFGIFFLSHFFQTVSSWLWPQHSTAVQWLYPSLFLDMLAFILVASLCLYKILGAAAPKDGASAIGKWPGLSCASIALLMVAALFTGTIYSGSLGIPGELYGKILSLMLGAAFLFSALLAVWLIYRGGRGMDRFTAFSHILGLACLAMNVMFACSHMNLRENFMLEIGKSAVVYLAAVAIGMLFAKNRFRTSPE